MQIKGKTVLVCNCEGTMPLDGAALARACGLPQSEIASHLCTREMSRFEQALQAGMPVIVACTQESPRFQEQREDLGVGEPVTYVNIRERAGWSNEAQQAHPKIAALLAEAALELDPAPTMTLKSEGVTLIYGRGEVAIEAARALKDRLNLTVLVTGADDVAPPATRHIPILKGRIVAAKGSLGNFEITVDAYAEPAPSSRARLQFGPARNGAKSRCDLILDLSDGAPIFPSSFRRDGYFRADPADGLAVQRAILAIGEMVGEFEKPLYIDYHKEICAHSRSRKIGCSFCIDHCPTGAIRPGKEEVIIDANLCAGCGTCSAGCPTGAAEYRLPKPDQLLSRARTLLAAYRAAQGKAAVLLVHDARHGAALIDALARLGEGLPARVIPFAVNETSQIGLEFLLGCLAHGAAELRLLMPARRREDFPVFEQNAAILDAVTAGLGWGRGRAGAIETDDPDALGQVLRAIETRDGPATSGFAPIGRKRELMTLGLAALHQAAPTPVDSIALPAGAPFGTVEVRIEGCTLCLACVSACPTGALGDNPDRPQLHFAEDACVQCGLCQTTCPERVISLVPRLDFTAEARRARVIKEEEPFACVRCGKPFGAKSSVERVVAQLAGKHWMFEKAALVERMKMCGDCRIIAQTETALDPYAGPARPQIRTTEDYKRELAEKAARGKIDEDS
jgi:ferredoxin